MTDNRRRSLTGGVSFLFGRSESKASSDGESDKGDRRRWSLRLGQRRASQAAGQGVAARTEAEATGLSAGGVFGAGLAADERKTSSLGTSEAASRRDVLAERRSELERIAAGRSVDDAGALPGCAASASLTASPPASSSAYSSHGRRRRRRRGATNERSAPGVAPAERSASGNNDRTVSFNLETAGQQAAGVQKGSSAAAREDEYYSDSYYNYDDGYDGYDEGEYEALSKSSQPASSDDPWQLVGVLNSELRRFNSGAT